MSFSADLDRIIKKTKVSADTVTRKVAIDLFTSVIKKTPFDIGRARGNWQASIGSYNTGYDLNKSDKSGASATSEAVSVAIRAKAGSVIYMVNSLPYIKALEYGHSSKQAPNGMVRLTITEYERYIRDAVRSLR